MKKCIKLTSIILTLFVSLSISNASLAITSENKVERETESKNEKILIVLTSHTELGNTGKKQDFGYLS